MSSFKFLMGSGCGNSLIDVEKKCTRTERTFSSTVFMRVMATSVFWTRSSSAFSMSSLACSCFVGSVVFNLTDLRQSLHRRTPETSYDCLAASSSSLLARTAWRAFIATLIEVDSVVRHGWRYCLRIASSWWTRALETVCQAPAYKPSARPSLSSSPLGASCNTVAAFVAARPSACGSVLCCAATGAMGFGAGMLVPLRLVAAKLVMPCPMVVDSSVIDS